MKKKKFEDFPERYSLFWKSDYSRRMRIATVKGFLMLQAGELVEFSSGTKRISIKFRNSIKQELLYLGMIDQIQVNDWSFTFRNRF